MNNRRTRLELQSNSRLRLCHARKSSLLVYQAAWARVRERAIAELDVGDSGMVETVAICRFAPHLLVQIPIRGVSGCISFWLSQ